MHHPEVENPHLEVFKHGTLHCMEEVGHWEVAHDTGNMLKHVESSIHLGRGGFGIGCCGVGIAECSMYVVIPSGLLFVRR